MEVGHIPHKDGVVIASSQTEKRWVSSCVNARAEWSVETLLNVVPLVACLSMTPQCCHHVFDCLPV